MFCLENTAMLRLCAEAGMIVRSCEVGSDVKVGLDLRAHKIEERFMTL